MKKIILKHHFYKKNKTISSLSTTEKYHKHTKKKICFLIAFGLLLIILSLITIRLGSTDLNFKQILKYLFSPDDSWNSSVLWKLRIPRVLAAILAGASLGIAGVVMQSILRNPLASPFTLGISNSAAFGAALAIVVFNGGSMIGRDEVFSMVSNPIIVTLCSFSCAILATIIIILLIKLTSSTPESIVLAGLAINSIFATGLAILTYFADDTAIASIVFWQFGSLSKSGWSGIAIIAAIFLLSFIYFFFKRWDYNSMEAGEDVAQGLGVNISRTRIFSLIISALLTSTVVSFFGIIGFIGLIGPHMVKKIIGNDNRFTILGSALTGAFIMMLSHIIGSYAFSMALPVGIITSAIGGPLFLIILLRGGKK